jgi:hypothetical protein
MLDRCRSIYLGFKALQARKKAGTETMVPAVSWLVARIKTCVGWTAESLP